MGRVHPCLWDTQRCPLSTSQHPAECVLVQMPPVFNITQCLSKLNPEALVFFTIAESPHPTCVTDLTAELHTTCFKKQTKG